MSVAINETNFPDSVFRQYISENFDLDHDGILSDSEIANINSISITIDDYWTYKDLTSIAGIELFPNITSVDIEYCGLIEADFSSNTLLESLILNSLPLERLNISGTLIKNFYYYSRTGSSYNGLIELNASNCLQLEALRISGGFSLSLSIFNISGSNKLRGLYLYGYHETELDLTEFTNLEVLCLNYNPLLQSINVSTCKKLVYFYIRTSPNITIIDLSNCKNIKYVSIGHSLDTQDSLTEIKLNSEATDLRYLSASEFYNLQKINIPKAPKLQILNLTMSKISNLFIKHSPILVDLYKNVRPYHWKQGGLDYYEYKRQLEEARSIDLPEIDGFEKIVNEDWAIYDKLCVGINQKVLVDDITIASEPADATLSDPETSAIFQVEAYGDDLIYQWYVQTKDDDAWTNLETLDATTSELTVSYEAAADGNKYMCMITSGDSEKKSKEATLTVLALPIITQQPSDVTVYSGQEATFSIKAEGNGLSYQWVSGSATAPDLYWAKIANATEATLTVVASYYIDGLCYKCRVRNEIGEVLSDYAQLHVEIDDRVSKPVIVAHPQPATVNENESVTFSCEASGKDLGYQWAVRTYYETIGPYTDAEIYGATEATYTTIASMALNGTYFVCIVSNAAGSIKTNDAMLTVNKGQSMSVPLITNQPTSVVTKSGNRAGFRVIAEGGSLTYQWQVKRNGTWYDVTGETQSVYSFITRAEDNGLQYRCQIGNAAGTVYTTVVTLTISEETPLPLYGYHSIIISGKNTYGEWGMYPTSRPHVAVPEVKTNYVDLPGANGGIDYTELLIGEPTYGYRKGSWEFMLIPQQRWPDVFRSLSAYLHGKIHTVILEDDLDYEYTGRLSVNKWESLQHNSTIVIDYILEPVARNRSGETFDTDDSDFQAATRILRKPENDGKVLVLWNNYATVMPISEYYPDGDNIQY